MCLESPSAPALVQACLAQGLGVTEQWGVWTTGQVERSDAGPMAWARSGQGVSLPPGPTHTVLLSLQKQREPPARPELGVPAGLPPPACIIPEWLCTPKLLGPGLKLDILPAPLHTSAIRS